MNARPSFWDRRRAAVREEAEAEARSREAAQIAALPPEPEQSDEEILEALGLPDPDSLTAGDDFTAFMVKAVPHHLRNRALRKLWRSNPVLACLDGLNDYDDDYLTGSTGNGVIKTAYQVGKGMTFHVEKMARLKTIADEALGAPDGDMTGDATGRDLDDMIVSEATADLQEAPVIAGAAQPGADGAPEVAPALIGEATGVADDPSFTGPAGDAAPAVEPSPRRMVFRFEEGTA